MRVEAEEGLQAELCETEGEGEMEAVALAEGLG